MILSGTNVQRMLLLP
jgi:hypothetical protein